MLLLGVDESIYTLQGWPVRQKMIKQLIVKGSSRVNSNVVGVPIPGALLELVYVKGQPGPHAYFSQCYCCIQRYC